MLFMCLQNLPVVDKHCVINYSKQATSNHFRSKSQVFARGWRGCLVVDWVLEMIIYHSYRMDSQ